MQKKQKRSGKTIINSASVSKEFQDLIERYDLSPTECFRKGVAVSLCELGYDRYDNPMNRKRLNQIKEFDRIVKRSEKLQNYFHRLLRIAEMLKEIKEDETELR